MQVIGYARNPEPDDPEENPLDDVNWDEDPVDLSNPDILGEITAQLRKCYQDLKIRYNIDNPTYLDPIKFFKTISSSFFILPNSPRIVRNSSEWVEEINLDHYDDDVAWKDIVKEVREKSYQNYGNDREPDPDRYRE